MTVRMHTTSKSGHGLSSHMLFTGALGAPYHITANTLENMIALMILVTFNIYIHSFPFTIPQLSNLLTFVYLYLVVCSRQIQILYYLRKIKSIVLKNVK